MLSVATSAVCSALHQRSEIPVNLDVRCSPPRVLQSNSHAEQSGENHRAQMELSMYRAEKEALNEDRQKMQRQLMALQGDKESLEEKLRSQE